MMSGPAVSHACPTKEELGRFSRGDLPASRLEELAEHLEGCHDCQTSLNGLAGQSDDLLIELRGIGLLDRVVDNAISGEMATVESSVVAFLSDTCEERLPPTAVKEVPKRLGEYEILAPVGRGGMGAVYRARHSSLDKLVAIKLLPPHRFGDGEADARFRREMRAIGKLAHPNVVAATDAGEIDGVAYLVMEFVAGADLAQIVKRHGRLPVAEACELVRQAALGLHYAHCHGLVHRDVKPSNLLLTISPDQSSGGLVKLSDLGLALLREVESEDVGSETTANLMIGSFDYMAPEQADDAHRVDHRADLYALGCTIYELLSGRPPFAAPRYRTRLQKMKAHADAAAPSLAGACASIPPGLDQLIGKLLAKNPADRFGSAAELAAALTPFAAGANLVRLVDETSPHVSPLAASDAPPRRRKVPTGVVLGCFAALMAASVIYVQTDRGTLEIQSDTDEVKVRVEQDGKLITLVDLKSNKEIRLRSGTYQVALGDAEQDLGLDADEFTLRRGGKEVVHIRRQPPTLIKLPFAADEAKRHQERWARFRGVGQTIKNDLGISLALVPPGEFDMRPGYRVKLTRPYYLGAHEVTVAQFRRVVEEANYKSTLEEEGRGVVELDTFTETAGLNWRSPALALGDNHPVTGVSWVDADRFCAWLSDREKKRYRLPTEAEWEWAARCGSATMFPWGDDWHAGGDYEWYNDNSDGHIHPVAQKRPNAWGLYDLVGNLVEWCGDWSINPLPQAEVSDPTGPLLSAGTRVLRGGSFREAAAPFTNRGSFGPANSMIHVGFRVCREL